jgi:hypothetical protein
MRKSELETKKKHAEKPCVKLHVLEKNLRPVIAAVVGMLDISGMQQSTWCSFL